MTCLVDGSDDVHGIQCELAAEALRCYGTLRLQVTGWSMLPAIWPGDILFVESATSNGVKEGDVVLYGRGRRLFAHRIVKKLNGSKLVTRGDANPRPDPVVHSEELLGRVSSIVKNEKCVELRSSRTLCERAIAAVVRKSHVGMRIVVSVRSWAAISKFLHRRNGVGSLPELIAEVDRLSLTIEIGEMPVRVQTSDRPLFDLLHRMYQGFVGSADHAEIDLTVELAAPECGPADAPVQVTCQKGRWTLERGDFISEWEPSSGRGWIRHTDSPYSVDAVLRIVHSILLARRGGFLLHSASLIRDGKAFLFAGASEAGKTTISRLAPPHVTLLTDEISYVRRQPGGYFAFGTPFRGELAKPGENVSAPISHLYLLAKGQENRIDPVASADAVRSLLSNVLFFANDDELVQAIFHSAFEFVSRVPVSRLTFVPDARAWELIQ